VVNSVKNFPLIYTVITVQNLIAAVYYAAWACVGRLKKFKRDGIPPLE